MKLEDNQGHSGAGPSWKFWRRLSIRSRGHETGRGKGNKRNSDAGISKADIGQPALDLGYRPQRLPDVVGEGGHHLPVFNANAVPPPKPPRLFLPKTLSHTGSRSSSAESISEHDENRLNNNNDDSISGSPNTWHLLDSDDFSLETRQALGHVIYSSSSSTSITTTTPTNNNNNIINDSNTSYAASGKTSPPFVYHVVDEEEEEGGERGEDVRGGGGSGGEAGGKGKENNVLSTSGPRINSKPPTTSSQQYDLIISSSQNSNSRSGSNSNSNKMGNSMVPVCIIQDDTTSTTPDIMLCERGNNNNNTTNGGGMRHSSNNNSNSHNNDNGNNLLLTSSPSSIPPPPPTSPPPPRPSSPRSSPPGRTRTVSGSKHIYNQYHQNGFGTVPRKPKIVTPELSQKRYRRPRSRKLSSCDDQVSRQWRIMTSVVDLMCQRLDPYPLLDPLKRAGVLSNIQLQSFLGHCDRRSICEGLVDIIGKGTPKCLSVFSAAISACPGNCTEILEILQAMREIDRLVYDIPEQKPSGSLEETSDSTDESTSMLSTTTTSTTRTTKTATSLTSVSSTTATSAVTEDKILNFDIGYLSTDYSLKPLVELDRVRSNSGGSSSSSSNGGVGGGVGVGVGGVTSTGGGGNVYQNRRFSRNSSYSLLDASMGSTTTLDKASYCGNAGDPTHFSGLVMMSVIINGHNLGGDRCRALVDVIRTHNCISELHLGKTHLSGQEVTSIAQALSAETSSTCHTLDLRLNAIDTVGAHGIGMLLRQTRFLRVLNLSSTELSSLDFQEIVSAISGNKSLVEFDGSFLDISDECCVELRDMLRANTHLQKLRLRGNNLTPVGCQTVCKGLAKNITLSVLDLSRNPIGDAGVEALSLYLPDSHVTEVYIDGCGITSSGGQALAEMVSDSKRLRHLDVSTNDLQDSGVSRMASALERTSSLMTVSMNMCSVTNDGFAKILDAMEKNTSIHRLKLCYNKIGKGEHCNPAASSDNLRYRLRIVQSSRPKLKIILWGNAFEDAV